MVAYHGDVYACLGQRLRGASRGDYLARHGRTIARSSRIIEPYVGAFVRRLVHTHRPASLLEIGCGTGIHLRHALESDPDLWAHAVDIQPEVVDEAKANLQMWGVGDRATIELVDVADDDAMPTGLFDLVTLYNNAYYFSSDERTRLFGRLRRRLNDGGALVLTTMVQGTTVVATDLDLALRSTVGCDGLPTAEALCSELKSAGYGVVERRRLMPLEPLYALVATGGAV